MRPITVNYLFFHDHRVPYAEIALDALARSSERTRAKIALNLFVGGQKDPFWKHTNTLRNAGIEVNLDFGRSSYMLRVHRMCEQSGEFMIKLDNDIFFNEHVWDFWIDNLERELSSDNVLLMTPVLSSGIPTCERFMKLFMGNHAKQLEELILKTKFPSSIWGNQCYGVLNKHIKKPWDPRLFFAEIAKLPAHQKGLHPIRFNFKLIKYINEFCTNNIDTFLQKREYAIVDMEEPYLCNSCVAIRTEIYKKIIEDPSIKVDAFDEMPINRYRHREGKKIRLIDNCFAIHPMYATYGLTIGHACNIDAEVDFFKKFKAVYRAAR